MNDTRPDLTIVIPAYNESGRIRPSLDRITSFLGEHDLRWEVLVVDDGSTDDTSKIVRERTQTEPRLSLVSLDENRGKGAAVKAGALRGRGRYILFSDADLSTDIAEVLGFLEEAERGADIVIGSRVLPGSTIVGWNPWYRILSGRTFNRAIRIIALPGISDTQCGFKMFSNRAAKDIFSRARIFGFGFDVELLAIGRHLGYRIAELPITWNNARDSKVNLARHTLPMLSDVFEVRRNLRRGRYGPSRPLET